MKSTRDSLFGGKVIVHQLARGEGYRINVDALLLAGFAAGSRTRSPRGETPPVKTTFDLGSGVGAVGLSLLHLNFAERVEFVDIDLAAVLLAERNLVENGWSARGRAVCADVRDVAAMHSGEADLVVCNPPYVEKGRGKSPQNASIAAARTGSLRHFIEAARALSARRARVCFVYPAQELTTLVLTFRAAGLEPKRLRCVHSTNKDPARVVLVEARAGKTGGMAIAPPLIERDLAGTYGEELRLLLEGSLGTRFT